MRKVHRSALMPFSPAQMYGLVTDVLRYPEFLPWCSSASILGNDDPHLIVRLGLTMGPIQSHFTTRNLNLLDSSVEMQLVDGPFQMLQGRWDFTPIGDAGSRIELGLRFETAGALTSLALGPAFEGVCNQLVDAFGRRAREVLA